MKSLAALLLLSGPLVHASPLTYDNTTLTLLQRSPNFEWTAWGDSYASGVGSTKYVDGRRCLRYDAAYPVQMSEDPDRLLPGQGGKFNNVVCSGAKADEVEKYQLFVTETWVQRVFGSPNPQYYPRPLIGKPTIGTLTVGGDDIDFPGILDNCILESFPFPLSQGFTHRTCDEQRALTWSLISDGDHTKPAAALVAKIDSVIRNIVKAGQTATGASFRLYVTSYGQFFNDQTDDCDKVTFARLANPKPDGKQHVLLSRELRADFNAMSQTLNQAIFQAVNLNYASNVRYIDIDAMLTGHRFCENGIVEPDQGNANLWFWHYPYKENNDATDPTIAYLNSVAQKAENKNALTWDPKTTLYVDYMNTFWDQVNEHDLGQAAGAPANGLDFSLNAWVAIGSRARVFHPQPAYHEAIYKKIVEQYISDITPVAAPAGVATS